MMGAADTCGRGSIIPGAGPPTPGVGAPSPCTRPKHRHQRTTQALVHRHRQSEPWTGHTLGHPGYQEETAICDLCMTRGMQSLLWLLVGAIPLFRYREHTAQLAAAQGAGWACTHDRGLPAAAPGQALAGDECMTKMHATPPAAAMGSGRALLLQGAWCMAGGSAGGRKRTIGACPGAAAGRPRPAARPMPGPAGAVCPFMREVSAGGGPSIVSEITSSPRSSTRPSTRRCSRCTPEQAPRSARRHDSSSCGTGPNT